MNGGAVAIGHPIGASGARVLVTLIYEMIRRDVKRGIAALCLGGGNAVAMAVERLEDSRRDSRLLAAKPGAGVWNDWRYARARSAKPSCLTDFTLTSF